MAPVEVAPATLWERRSLLRPRDRLTEGRACLVPIICLKEKGNKWDETSSSLRSVEGGFAQTRGHSIFARVGQSEDSAAGCPSNDFDHCDDGSGRDLREYPTAATRQD